MQFISHCCEVAVGCKQNAEMIGDDFLVQPFSLCQQLSPFSINLLSVLSQMLFSYGLTATLSIYSVVHVDNEYPNSGWLFTKMAAISLHCWGVCEEGMLLSSSFEQQVDFIIQRTVLFKNN